MPLTLHLDVGIPHCRALPSLAYPGTLGLECERNIMWESGREGGREGRGRGVQVCARDYTAQGIASVPLRGTLPSLVYSTVRTKHCVGEQNGGRGREGGCVYVFVKGMHVRKNGIVPGKVLLER